MELMVAISDYPSAGNDQHIYQVSGKLLAAYM